MSMEKKIVIHIENLTYAFGDYVALHDINFDIYAGDVVAVIGPNGSGKTTLLKNIIGLYPPTKGTVSVLGKSPKEVRTKIGYVPQKFDLDRKIPITVYEFMALERCGKASHNCNNISNALKQVDLRHAQNQKIGTLSGGQFQRMMIARALLHEKEILIFDEPSTGIDIKGEQTIYDLILSINKQYNTTCVIVSHELNIVSKYVHHVVCLNKQMICYGTPEKVITPYIGSSLG